MKEQLNSSESSTYRTHSFTDYCHLSLATHQQAIMDFLRDNPGVKILDVGCGSGVALKELVDICKKEGWTATFTGLDIEKEKPNDFPRDATYVSADISSFNVTAFKKQFDLIISVNVFPYIQHKEQALSNVAKMLSAKGKAFIFLEPFYFGPYGTQLFVGSNCCEWDSQYRNIIVRPHFSPVIIDKEAFCEYELPRECQSTIYRAVGDKKRPTVMVPLPVCYRPDVAEYFLTELGIKKECLEKERMGTNWDLVEFLSVKTPNHNGHPLCGTNGFRPFLSGVITPYFRQRNLPPEAVAVLLMMPEIYESHSRKLDWKSNATFVMNTTYCLEALRLIGENALPEPVQKNIQDAVQSEKNQLLLHKLKEMFSPKSMIKLLIAVVVLAFIIKVLLNLQNNTPRMGR